MKLYESYRIDNSAVGQVRGHWTQIGPAFSIKIDQKHRHRYAMCECKCGRAFLFRATYIRTLEGDKSCLECHATHGATRSPEWKCWISMIARCTCKTNHKWPKYGGVGIAVCDEWRHSFVTFLRDMGPRPSAIHSLDRWPDQGGNYEPSNVRWATPKEQVQNSSKPVFLTYNGRTLCLADWGKETGINWFTISTRVRAGWSVERALTAPVYKKGWRTRRAKALNNSR